MTFTNFHINHLISCIFCVHSRGFAMLGVLPLRNADDSRRRARPGTSGGQWEEEDGQEKRPRTEPSNEDPPPDGGVVSIGSILRRAHDNVVENVHVAASGANFRGDNFEVLGGRPDFQSMGLDDLQSSMPPHAPTFDPRELEEELEYEQRKQRIQDMLEQDPDYQFFKLLAGALGIPLTQGVTTRAMSDSFGQPGEGSLGSAGHGVAQASPLWNMAPSGASYQQGQVSGVLPGVYGFQPNDFKGAIGSIPRDNRSLVESMLMENLMRLSDKQRKIARQQAANYIYRPDVWRVIGIDNGMSTAYEAALNAIILNAKHLLDPRMKGVAQRNKLSRQLRHTEAVRSYFIDLITGKYVSTQSLSGVMRKYIAANARKEASDQIAVGIFFFRNHVKWNPATDTLEVE